MKKQIIVATGLAVLSTSAYATKARMQALGQDTGIGSHYIQDTRNIFRNAAHVNTFKNYIATEWGNAGATDAEVTPQAEGGFFREMGAFSYGLYFGSDEGAQNAMRAGGTGFAGTGAYGEAGLLSHDNGLDLFFAGDMGVQWGARLHYAKSENETTGSTKKEHSAMGLGLGIVMGDLEASVNYGLKDESKVGSSATDKWESDAPMNISVNYGLGDLTVFAEYDKQAVKYKNDTTAEIKTEQSDMLVGVAKTHEVSSSAVVTMAVAYNSTKQEDTNAAGAKTERTLTDLPVTITFETEATSWLTLRGSVSQNVFLNGSETKTAASTTKTVQGNTTDVDAGATLSFGKLKIDGVIGTTNGSRAGGFANANGTDETGVLALDNLMSRVAVHYWF